jgi:hypothetical protein
VDREAVLGKANPRAIADRRFIVTALEKLGRYEEADLVDKVG